VLGRAIAEATVLGGVPEPGQAGVVEGGSPRAGAGEVRRTRLIGVVTVGLDPQHRRQVVEEATDPGTERVDAHTIRFRAASIVDISRFIEFASSYRPDLTP
jgi:D-aminopeptidase